MPWSNECTQENCHSLGWGFPVGLWMLHNRGSVPIDLVWAWLDSAVGYVQFANDLFFLNDSFYWLESHDTSFEWLVHFSHLLDMRAAMHSTAGLICPPPVQWLHRHALTTNCQSCALRNRDHAAGRMERENTCFELITDCMLQELHSAKSRSQSS
jgi:hypothetical protein